MGDMEMPDRFSLPEKLSETDTGAIVRNVVIFLGAALTLVVVGTIVLSWFDKQIPEVLVVLAGLLAGYLGGTISSGVAKT